MNKNEQLSKISDSSSIEDITQFTESYRSFNKIINSLQRQYLELKEEFEIQNCQLKETNLELAQVNETNLQVSEFLNNILGSISAGVIAIDSKGIITHFNSAASKMLGIPIRQPIGQYYTDAMESVNAVIGGALQAVETGNFERSKEIKLVLFDNTHLHLSVSTSMLYNRDGKPVGAVEVFHDLTRLKKMEAEFNRMETLAALGEMAATIAHQVRNPLAGIGGFASLLKRDLDETDPHYNTVEKIITGVDNLNNSITALLNYTKTDQLHLESYNYDKLLNDLIDQFKLDHNNLTDFHIKMIHPENSHNAHIKLAVDVHLFRQLVNNVLINSIEANNSSVEIEVLYKKLSRQTACGKYSDKLLLGTTETVVETVFRDNGTGFKEEQTDTAFSPFFTTKQGGHGLGLAICRKIVKAHGGEMIVGNHQAGGAEVTVLLPLPIE